jgi:hypothetical protein
MKRVGENSEKVQQPKDGQQKVRDEPFVGAFATTGSIFIMLVILYRLIQAQHWSYVGSSGSATYDGNSTGWHRMLVGAAVPAFGVAKLLGLMLTMRAPN